MQQGSQDGLKRSLNGNLQIRNGKGDLIMKGKIFFYWRLLYWTDRKLSHIKLHLKEALVLVSQRTLLPFAERMRSLSCAPAEPQVIWHSPHEDIVTSNKSSFFRPLPMYNAFYYVYVWLILWALKWSYVAYFSLSSGQRIYYAFVGKTFSVYLDRNLLWSVICYEM